jgi:hypothetical protein
VEGLGKIRSVTFANGRSLLSSRAHWATRFSQEMANCEGTDLLAHSASSQAWGSPVNTTPVREH